jgi:hypothetical protein
MTDDQVARLESDRAAQARADKLWTPRLRAWKAALAKPGERAAAESALTGLTDPRAAPSVWRVFANGGAADQELAIETLGRIDGASASWALADLAVTGDTPEVRGRALETLRRRDPREFVGGLIALVREPVNYRAMPVGALGYGSPGFVAIEGRDAVFQTVFTVDEAFNNPDDAPTAKALAIRMKTRLKASLTYDNRVAVQNDRLASIVLPIEQSNALIRALNEKSTLALRQVTGQDLGTDPEAWKCWWADEQGYAYDGPAVDLPASTDQQPLSDQFPKPYERRKPLVPTRPRRQWPKAVYTGWVHLSCFAAGTPVVGIDGPRPIEKVRVGDRVLTQDPESGLLSVQPVVAVYHNDPATTLRLDLGGESVIATGIHRFWKAGHGWAMARDLKTGDKIRTAGGGLATVEGIWEHTVQPVFNLEVARGQSFFVGRSGVLVHDNSLVRPTSAPFDATPGLTVAARSGPSSD